MELMFCMNIFSNSTFSKYVNERNNCFGFFFISLGFFFCWSFRIIWDFPNNRTVRPFIMRTHTLTLIIMVTQRNNIQWRYKKKLKTHLIRRETPVVPLKSVVPSTRDLVILAVNYWNCCWGAPTFPPYKWTNSNRSHRNWLLCHFGILPLLPWANAFEMNFSELFWYCLFTSALKKFFFVSFRCLFL